MRSALWVLVTAACALADIQNRRTKLPYIADAVGNSLPPPSSVPATVGSPVNLLTPDRYEFYTFDESGELVKRLMTLEEIQAIVAAGEETEGLVTFANDNQPTIAFNFTQPSQTKVHSVVTNVQNVLKAQMEAHKNNPSSQPTLDTPDVSDSWSLILPSIFGNTGMDIVPDKTSDSFITPETETFEMDNLNEYKNSHSKESNEIPTVPTINKNNNVNNNSNKVTYNAMATTATVIKNTSPISTTTLKPFSTTVKFNNRQSTSTTTAAPTKTISKITTTQPQIFSSTTIGSTSTTPITAILYNTNSYKANKTQVKIDNTNKKVFNFTKVSLITTPVTYQPIQYEKLSTYLPVSTMAHVTEKTTMKPITSSKKTTFMENNGVKLPAITFANKFTTSTTVSALSINKDKQYEKLNSTTITTQSISPSTTKSSTEFTPTPKNYSQIDIGKNNDTESTIPIFDVAQSISQIASDLGNNFVPIPTSNSLLDTKKPTNLELESKENLEIDIPTESGETNEVKSNSTVNNPENFVQISTFYPHEKNETIEILSKPKEELKLHSSTSPPVPTSTTTTFSSPNIIDAIISESMGDLLSQVVHDGPDPTSIIYSQNDTEINNIMLTTQNPISHDATISETTIKIQEIVTTTILPQPIVENHNKVIEKPNEEMATILSNNFNAIIKNNTPSTVLKNDVSKIKVESTNHILNQHTQSEQIKSDILVEIVKNRTELDKNEEKTSTLNIPKSENSSFSSIPSKINSSDELVNTTFNNNIYKLSSTDKTTTIENNKVSNKFHKHKVTQEFPKIDEFKKKIQKVNIDDKELANERNNSWKLISTVKPSKVNDVEKDKHKGETFYTPESNDNKNIVLEFPKENQGLEVTTKDLSEDILQFSELCNELAFRYWNAMVENIDKKRSIVFSPYSITSMLAMMFMGARGATSGEMNEVLKLDDMVTFNPHFTLKNISDSIATTSASGVAISAFIRELYSERIKGKMLTFYKERAQQFYNGHVEEINFKLVSDVIRRRTNLLVKRYTLGRIHEYLKTNSIMMNPPLAAFSANLFYTDCTGSSVEGRDGEMYFVVSPNVRQRRLVPVPAVVYKRNFLAGYDPVLDATAAALGNTNSVVSTLFLMPGQQGNVVHAEDLENLEKRFLDTKLSTLAWNGLLRTLLPRFGLELQIPRFSHKSIFNVSSTLRKMGLKELFDADHADLGGLNGPSKDLYLSDMLQLTSFVTCGEGAIGEQHHIEEYPEKLDAMSKRRTSRWITGWDEPRDYQRAFHDPHDVGDAMHLPLHLRPRQARLPARSTQPARLKFDRPFLYFVRHNPSGMILYVGRYNPRLLP